MTLDRREFAGALAAACAASTLSVVPLAAKAPLAGAPAIGVARTKVGAIEMTALCDGYLDIGLDILKGVDDATKAAALKASFRPNGAHRSSVNAFVINSGDKLAIVDSGTVSGFSPNTARFHEAFKAAGFSPDAVDVILATHLHPDHVGGLFNASDALFPKAELVVHEKEHAFWTDAATYAQAPEGFKGFFDIARNALKPYANRTRRISGEAEVLPGVTAVELFGHTPGHTGFRISSGKEQMILFADVVHAPGIQFAYPEATLAFDTDQATAKATRLKLLDQVSTDGILVSGAHLDFPGFGHIAKAGRGYAFTAAPFAAGF